jgi:lipopolysaccharide/colanic/teichoic acid biosynthesis glycosyltransferase
VTGKLPALDRLHLCNLLFFRDQLSIHDHLQRSISVVLSIIGLVLCGPLAVTISLLIKADSRGPVFFRQERIGLNGHTFTLIKFRTMHPVDQSPSEWVRDNCERITRVGHWLRKFRLDELPQLCNVLRGDMNLVGPRPHPASNYQLFIDQIPFYHIRMRVRPGITGWAQVRYGYANDLDEEIEKMLYDLYYIKYHSFRLDLEIIFRTIKVIILGQESPAITIEPASRLNDERRAVA